MNSVLNVEKEERKLAKATMPLVARLGVIGLMLLALLTLVEAGKGLWAYFYRLAFAGTNYNWFFDVFVATKEAPELPRTLSTHAEFSQVTIWTWTNDLSDSALFYISLSDGYPFLIMGLGSFGVIMLCIGLLRARPFGRVAQFALGLGGLLSIIGSVLVPWSEKQAVAKSVEALGFPTSAEQTTSAMRDYVRLREFAWHMDTDWTWLILGVVLVLIAFYWQKATKFQRDQEGLV